jgi:hypothetical protein
MARYSRTLRVKVTYRYRVETRLTLTQRTWLQPYPLGYAGLDEDRYPQIDSPRDDDREDDTGPVADT